MAAKVRSVFGWSLAMIASATLVVVTTSSYGASRREASNRDEARLERILSEVLARPKVWRLDDRSSASTTFAKGVARISVVAKDSEDAETPSFIVFDRWGTVRREPIVTYRDARNAHGIFWLAKDRKLEGTVVMTQSEYMDISGLRVLTAN